MAKTVKDTLYLDEGSHSFIVAEDKAGRLNKQRFYNIAIQNEIEKLKQEKRLLEQIKR